VPLLTAKRLDFLTRLFTFTREPVGELDEAGETARRIERNLALLNRERCLSQDAIDE